MKIGGKEWDGAPPLTVGALKKFIADHEAKVGNIDDHLVHFLQMEGPLEGDDHSAYATGVEIDCFDTDTGDDSENSKPVRVLSLEHWPHRADDASALRIIETKGTPT